MTSLSPPILSTVQSSTEFEIDFDKVALAGRNRRRPDGTTETGCEDEEWVKRVYEIKRTVEWVKSGRFGRVGLQFPDEMLCDAVAVVRSLGVEHVDVDGDGDGDGSRPTYFVLADTSYRSCCVDEVGAEHADADAVVHYGRACLSPPARLPVLWIYTDREVDDDLWNRICEIAAERKIIVVADLPYVASVDRVLDLEFSRSENEQVKKNVFRTEVVRDPGARIPNSAVVGVNGPVLDDEIRECVLLHVGIPPPAMVLTLAARVDRMVVYDVEAKRDLPSRADYKEMVCRGSSLVTRRYATVASVASAGIWGILLNTLSIRDGNAMVRQVQKMLSSAGKKSYTVVVGKINPAKLANFADIEAWVVVGCWQGSLVDDASQLEYWRPLVTPFELAVALTRPENRVWTGEWESDLGVLMDRYRDQPDVDVVVDNESDEEPEFDLRTGRYISKTISRPIAPVRPQSPESSETAAGSDTVWKPDAKTDLAFSIGGVVSPAARFLNSSREWTGLGCDYGDDGVDGDDGRDDKAGAVLEDGIGGTARGYAHLSVGQQPKGRV